MKLVECVLRHPASGTYTSLGRGVCAARLPVDEKEHQASSRARRRGLKGCSLPIHPGGEASQYFVI